MQLTSQLDDAAKDLPHEIIQHIMSTSLQKLPKLSQL